MTNLNVIDEQPRSFFRFLQPAGAVRSISVNVTVHALASSHAAQAAQCKPSGANVTADALNEVAFDVKCVYAAHE